MTPGPRYSDPFHWWGPGWDAPARRDLHDLLRDGTIDCGTAAVLWAVLARRRSLVVVAGPSGAGKTTVLTALLDFLPPGTRRLYLRGCFETFAFLSDPELIPTQTALLINELSPHLPVYLWGAGVARVIDAVDRGFMLLATAHAASLAEFVAGLTSSPLRIPTPRVAAFEFVVLIDHSSETQSGRQVRGVSRLRATRSGVEVDSLESQFTPWFPDLEIAARCRILEDLRDARIAALPAFR